MNVSQIPQTYLPNIDYTEYVQASMSILVRHRDPTLGYLHFYNIVQTLIDEL